MCQYYISILFFVNVLKIKINVLIENSEFRHNIMMYSMEKYGGL